MFLLVPSKEPCIIQLKSNIEFDTPCKIYVVTRIRTANTNHEDRLMALLVNEFEVFMPPRIKF